MCGGIKTSARRPLWGGREGDELRGEEFAQWIDFGGEVHVLRQSAGRGPNHGGWVEGGNDHADCFAAFIEEGAAAVARLNLSGDLHLLRIVLKANGRADQPFIEARSGADDVGERETDGINSITQVVVVTSVEGQRMERLMLSLNGQERGIEVGFEGHHTGDVADIVDPDGGICVPRHHMAASQHFTVSCQEKPAALGVYRRVAGGQLSDFEPAPLQPLKHECMHVLRAIRRGREVHSAVRAQVPCALYRNSGDSAAYAEHERKKELAVPRVHGKSNGRGSPWFVRAVEHGCDGVTEGCVAIACTGRLLLFLPVKVNVHQHTDGW